MALVVYGKLLLAYLMHNEQDVFINPLDIIRVIKMVSQVSLKLYQGCSELALRVEIKSRIVMVLRLVAKSLQVSSSIELESLCSS